MVSIERDGRVASSAKPPNDLGTVPPDELRALESAINSTDFAAIRRHPFTGTCPTAYHAGEEYIFWFGTPTGGEQIATCQFDVDSGSPLFVAVSAALAPFAHFPPG